MASRRKTLVSIAALAVLGLTGYYLYAVFAAQGQGTLAQSPLNIQASVKPAFIMAVDDSGSMTYETLFPGNSGQGHWSAATSSTNGFYNASGTLNPAGDGLWAHVMPNGITIDANNRLNIPPVDNFGFARSPEENPSYFNPGVIYEPWRQADGTLFANASITAALSDPRNAGSIAFDMTSVRFDNNTARDFKTRNGMVLAAGTQYWARISCGGLGTTAGARDKWVSLGAAHTVTGTCDLSLSYFPATFYLKATSPAPVGYVGGRVLATNACGAACNMWRYEITAANFGAAYPAMIQNFANWYSYYGNRNRAMVAGMTQSMTDVKNMRVGYFTINNRTPTVAMRDMGVPADKALLYTSLLSLPASGGTPNLHAVNHIGQQFQRTDANAPVQLACQKNAGMLFTDGFSNSGSPGAPEVTGLGAPFDPTPANSLAAIATRYYQATLRTGAGFPGGKVPVPIGCSAPTPDTRLDCRADPHMNFYGVTLGATGKIYDPDVARDPHVVPYPAWEGHYNDDPRTVDDIWHASVNTRGEYINAQTPAAITEAMRRILASVGGGTTPSGTIALTGSRIGAGSLTVIPEYTSANNGTDWYSTLTAATVTSTPATGVTFTNLWEASAQLPSGARDTIWMARNAASGVKPTVGKLGSTATLTLQELCSDALASCTQTGTRSIATKLGVTIDEAIAYLKGDASLEINGATGKLRKRTTRLGDIVNSSPVVAAPTDDFGYRSLRTSATVFDALDYKSYLEAKKTRTPMVYVGANDGMLHAFNGVTGAEQFAYIPTTSWGHMGNLLFPYNVDDKNFQVFDHRYYVDGPINVSDVHDGSWKTVLVGTSGSGGRSVFAIDVTNPGFTASKVLWELNDSVSLATVKNNIGHVLGKPVIVPVKKGATVTWKAIFGNGYGSINGKAALYVVDIGTGVTEVITASETGGPSMNGLGNIVAIDRYVGDTATRGRDGFVDTVYGGDQNGAVWKFDLGSGANQTTPFFVATDKAGERQAILGGFEAASGPAGGVMIYFGTGSFSFVGDPDDRQLQTFYGVLDTGAAVAGRSALLAQRVVTDTLGTRTVTTNGLGFSNKGWLVDLGVTATSGGATVMTGERSVGNPVVTSGVVFFPTFDPNTTDSCATGGVNRLYGLNALSGGAALSQARVGSPDGALPASGTGAINLATTGSAPIKDLAVLTTPRNGFFTGAPGVPPPPSGCFMTVQVAGAPPLYLPRPCGRQSWRQVR